MVIISYEPFKHKLGRSYYANTRALFWRFVEFVDIEMF